MIKDSLTQLKTNVLVFKDSFKDDTDKIVRQIQETIDSLHGENVTDEAQPKLKILNASIETLIGKIENKDQEIKDDLTQINENSDPLSKLNTDVSIFSELFKDEVSLVLDNLSKEKRDTLKTSVESLTTKIEEKVQKINDDLKDSNSLDVLIDDVSFFKDVFVDEVSSVLDNQEESDILKKSVETLVSKIEEKNKLIKDDFSLVSKNFDSLDKLKTDVSFFKDTFKKEIDSILNSL